MRSEHTLISLVLTGLCLVGCQTILALPSTQTAPKYNTAPTDTESPNPSIQRVEAPAYIGHLKGPATATVSEPVTIAVWAFVGTNGCDQMGTVSIEVNERAQSATLRATAVHPVDRRVAACLAVVPGFEMATVSFTPNATGTYLLRAEPFQPMSEGELATTIGQDVTPAATLAIEVVTP